MWNHFWSLRISDRLSQWKDFRRQISNQPLQQALEEVNSLWSSAPFVNYYLSPDTPNEWPNPWTLLAENYYCDVAKALGIVYTVYFTSHKSVPVEYRIYYDYDSKTRYNLAVFDNGKYILNYWPHEIVNTELLEQHKLQLLYRYTNTELSLDKY